MLFSRENWEKSRRIYCLGVLSRRRRTTFEIHLKNKIARILNLESNWNLSLREALLLKDWLRARMRKFSF